MFGSLVNILAGPILSSVMGPFEVYMKQKGATARDLNKIRGEVEQQLYQTLDSVTESQASVIKAEVTNGSILGMWRSIAELCFTAVFIFYALWVPMSVAYWGFPAPRIGDQLLEWCFDLLKIGLSGYVGISALDKVLTSVHRGRVR